MDNLNNSNMYNGSFYNGNVPNGGMYNGTVPNGGMMNGTVPGGGMPNGMMPGGTMPNGTIPGGGMMNGTVPGTTMPSGGMMNGTMPSGSMTTPNVTNLPPYDNCINCKCRGFYYVIKKGDTLYKLSRTFGVSVSDIMMSNPYINIYNLQVDDEICIPKAIEILPNM